MEFLHIIRASARIIARIAIDLVHRLLVNIFDTLFGFLNWPEKKLRIRVFVLMDEQKNPVVSPVVLDKSIEYAKDLFSQHFNVRLLPVDGSFVEVMPKDPPSVVLHTKGGIGALMEEFKLAGNFYAFNLAGSIYPITAFVVSGIKGAAGCSLGPASDYVTLDTFGAKHASILAHELAHACGLWHLPKKSNIMWRYKDRGEEVYWWQKNLFRSSRHITYW